MSQSQDLSAPYGPLGQPGADNSSADADIVVAGAGHNSLITACYLAKAGYRVLVLDARPIPGGGAATEEPLLPGYRIDSCSTGHTIIQGNPLIADDELGLLAEHGLLDDVLVRLVLAVAAPRPRNRDLVEQRELHRLPPIASATRSASEPSRSRIG